MAAATANRMPLVLSFRLPKNLLKSDLPLPSPGLPGSVGLVLGSVVGLVDSEGLVVGLPGSEGLVVGLPGSVGLVVGSLGLAVGSLGLAEGSVEGLAGSSGSSGVGVSSCWRV